MEEFGPALLIFAVAGYITLQNTANRTRFRSIALKWEQNVFESAACGLVMFFFVRFLVARAQEPEPWPIVGFVEKPVWAAGQAVLPFIKKMLPFRFSGSLIATFIFGIGIAWLSNLWWRAPGEVRRAVRGHGGDLRVFLHEKAGEGAPVSLTMKNRKVYVGLVTVPPGLREPSYVTLLPTLSGYRDEHTLRLIFTTPYGHVYEDLERRRLAKEELAISIESFAIVLPLENIDSANQFDDDAYTRYFAGVPRPGSSGAAPKRRR